MSEIKYRREALNNIPAGYFEIPRGEKLQVDDLVWSWTSHEFMRADDSRWMFSPLQDATDIICVVRKPRLSQFELSVPVRKTYTVK